MATKIPLAIALIGSVFMSACGGATASQYPALVTGISIEPVHGGFNRSVSVRLQVGARTVSDSLDIMTSERKLEVGDSIMVYLDETTMRVTGYADSIVYNRSEHDSVEQIDFVGGNMIDGYEGVGTVYAVVDTPASSPDIDAILRGARALLTDRCVDPSRAHIRFVVEEDGSVSNIKLLDYDGLCDDVPIDSLVIDSASWTPAVLDGRKVRSLWMVGVDE